ncbi:FMN-binding protein [Chitinispirillales bacterium ANBcel5]|uniref:FMN-binding protein n=1 Tax=Cellulosispirillum alkaliphilum TaxID=3039283 RepID=UPI002A581AC5|nr:FMN-binding protein [Chitinispirillales bacterium ANBcel5]
MVRKIVIGVFIFVPVLILVAGGVFYARLGQMGRALKVEYERIAPVDLEGIGNGTYKGSFGVFLVHVDLEVTVSEGRITGIDVIEQISGPGYEALETVDRIIEAQSPKVDAITEATGSSICIMAATHNALIAQKESTVAQH